MPKRVTIEPHLSEDELETGYRQMRFRLRVPRPEHTESSQEEQAEWKKKFGDQDRTNTNSTPLFRRGSMGNG